MAIEQMLLNKTTLYVEFDNSCLWFAGGWGEGSKWLKSGGNILILNYASIQYIIYQAFNFIPKSRARAPVNQQNKKSLEDKKSKVENMFVRIKWSEIICCDSTIVST